MRKAYEGRLTRCCTKHWFYREIRRQEGYLENKHIYNIHISLTYFRKLFKNILILNTWISFNDE